MDFAGKIVERFERLSFIEQNWKSPFNEHGANRELKPLSVRLILTKWLEFDQRISAVGFSDRFHAAAICISRHASLLLLTWKKRRIYRMVIAFQCSQCQSKLRVGDDQAGKKGKCPKCQAVVLVPVPAPSTDPVIESSSNSPKVAEGLASQTKKIAAPVEQISQDTPLASYILQQDDTTESQPAPKRKASAKIAPPIKPTSKRELSKRYKEILEGFDGTFIKPRPTGLHLLAGTFVSLIVLCLPIVYLGVVAGFGYATYYHATEHAWIVTGSGEYSRSGRAIIFAAAVYLIPILAGVTAVFFLLKPFFAPRLSRRPAVLIHEGDEPLVWAFVRKVCGAVGAPVPKEIAIDTDANAYAGFRNGMWSIFGNDMKLTIGLSLVGGLTLNQFAGVLAHEFGHFSQRYSMRVNYILQTMQGWFFRISYERDSWDAFLEELTHEEQHWAFMIFGLLARLCVFISRLILRVFAFTSLILSRWLLRQMEFDADRYQVTLVGKKEFEATFSRIELLSFADAAASHICRMTATRGGLPNNYPAFVLSLSEHMPEAERKKIKKEARKREHSIFDTHPSTKDRIASAKRITSEPIFHCEGAAGDLFRDFNLLSHEVSFDLYRSVFSTKRVREMLKPNSEFIDSN